MSANGTSSAPSRVSAHSHIRGLGIREDGTAEHQAGGFVGQTAAREALGLIVDLIRARRMAGRAVLLAGPPGSGKTALALGMARELGPKVPFCAMVASEVYSAEVSKTAVLAEYFRRTIGLRIKENKEVFEGEVTELTVDEADAPHGGYGRTIAAVLVTLRSARGTKTLKLDASAYEQLQKERVAVGDVIYIEAQSGTVRRVGRSDALVGEADLEADTYVPIPKGDVHKRRQVVQDVTLHDLDQANAKPTGGQDLAAMMAALGPGAARRTEVTAKLRREVDRAVDKHLQSGVAELAPGVLLIDEAHALDLECFAYLNRALESPMAPVVVLATNRGWAPLRGSGTPGGAHVVRSPHGLPPDLLDRMVVVHTAPYGLADAGAIVAQRAAAERVSLSPEARAWLAERASGVPVPGGAVDSATGVAMSGTASLRYALQLLAPAAILASVRLGTTPAATDDTPVADSNAEASADGAPVVPLQTIDLCDVEEAGMLFLDPGRSAAAAASWTPADVEMQVASTASG